MLITKNEESFYTLDFDHVALTVRDLKESISFYSKLGYKLINIFNDDDYNWATLDLNNHILELFEKKVNKEDNMDHIAYSYSDFDEIEQLINSLGYKKEELDIFYGDLNRESFCIKDNDGRTIQFIKK